MGIEQVKRQVNYIYKAPEYIAIWIILVCLTWYTKNVWLLIVTVTLLFVLLSFFRGWLGPIPIDKNIIMSPCDGKVLQVKRHEDKGYIQIAIFLNVHNIHVQYVPCDGIVRSVIHKDGEFHPAYLFEKSQLNEQTQTLIESPRFGNVYCVQIAGLVARRIVSMVEPGEQVIKGQPLGLIKLGSRVDVWVPYDASSIDVAVVEGQRVHIGDILIVKKMLRT